MSFSVEWSKVATKQLLNIPKKQRLIILYWIQEHLDGCEDPRRAPNGKQLQGTVQFRTGSERRFCRSLRTSFENWLIRCNSETDGIVRMREATQNQFYVFPPESRIITASFQAVFPALLCICRTGHFLEVFS